MKALVLWQEAPWHDLGECATIYRDWLEELGFFVRVEESAAAFAEPCLGEYALVVPLFTIAKLERAAADNLAEAVQRGTGLAGHHGTCDAFRESTVYQFITGGQFVAHPGGVVDYRVEIARRDTIMHGIEAFDHRSEQWYVHVDPANEVLATTRFTGEHAAWLEGVVMPVVWKKRFGRGRVFFSSLGHEASELRREPVATIMKRGLRWAARGKS